MFPLTPEAYLEVAHQRMQEDAEAARQWRLARDARPAARRPAGRTRLSRAAAATVGRRLCIPRPAES